MHMIPTLGCSGVMKLLIRISSSRSADGLAASSFGVRNGSSTWIRASASYTGTSGLSIFKEWGFCGVRPMLAGKMFANITTNVAMQAQSKPITAAI